MGAQADVPACLFIYTYLIINNYICIYKKMLVHFLVPGHIYVAAEGAHSRCWLILSRPCVIHVCICVFCSGFRFVVLAAADSCPCATQTCHLKILFLCSGMPRLALKPATRELLRLHRLGRLARFQLRFQPVAMNPCQSHSFSVQAWHHTSSFVHRAFRSRLRARKAPNNHKTRQVVP